MHGAASRALFENEVKEFSEELELRRGWKFHSVEYPVIDCSFKAPSRTTLRVRMVCDNWNDLAPAISLHAADGTLLTALPPNPTGVFNTNAHPLTGRPFVCMRGSREYHTHTSHTDDLWQSVQGTDSYTLGGILTQLWHAWLKGSG